MVGDVYGYGDLGNFIREASPFDLMKRTDRQRIAALVRTGMNTNGVICRGGSTNYDWREGKHRVSFLAAALIGHYQGDVEQAVRMIHTLECATDQYAEGFTAGMSDILGVTTAVISFLEQLQVKADPYTALEVLDR